MAFTMPEGVPTPTPVSEYSLPQTLRFETPKPAVGSLSFLTVISIILGIVLATGSVVGVVGKAFFVDRNEYNVQVVTSAEERGKVTETLKRLDQSIARLEASIEKISTTVDSLRDDNVQRRRGR